MIRKLRRAVYGDPLYAGRHPFQTYLLALCVISGVPKLFGVTTSESIDAELPEWLAYAWGFMLSAGSLAALVGAYWRGQLATALTVERAGLAAVGAAAIVYGVVIVVAVHLPGLLAAGIVVGFGLFCVRRARDIGHVIKTAIQVAKEQAEG